MSDKQVNKKLIPEITAVKKLVTDLKDNLLCFVDVHHHCVKRGAFMYGPSCSAQLEAQRYKEIRALPKMIDLATEMFRFHACRFKANEHWKENCARYWAEKEGAQFSYCLECSQ